MVLAKMVPLVLLSSGRCRVRCCFLQVFDDNPFAYRADVWLNHAELCAKDVIRYVRQVQRFSEWYVHALAAVVSLGESGIQVILLACGAMVGA
jgi:hypothetical protein